MGKASGEQPGYRRFVLVDHEGKPTPVGFDLPRVSTILKSVLSAGMGGMAFWGFRLGIASQHPRLAPERIEELYEQAKRGAWNPNRQRDVSGDRGVSAHGYLESLCRAAAAEARGQADGVLSTVPAPSNGYEEGVLNWFRDRGLVDDPSRVLGSEVDVWHLQRGYVGKFDALLRTDHQAQVDLEITDLKTHKPARDHENVGGPAYETDLLQLAAYEGAIVEMTPPQERPSHLDHCVVLAADDGSYVEDRRWISPEIFYEVVDVYWALTEVGLNGRG